VTPNHVKNRYRGTLQSQYSYNTAGNIEYSVQAPGCTTGYVPGAAKMWTKTL